MDFRSIRGVVADMDGVLWRDQEILPGAAAFFQFLHHKGLPYAFATNNSTRPAEYYVEKISRIGIAVQEVQIISSSIATADFLAQHYPPETVIYVIGEQGLKSTLQARGFTVLDTAGEQPAVVVVGLDRAIEYQKIHFAAMYIRQGAAFIATNPDKTFPIPGGLSPGAGSIIASVEAASGKTPQFIGKPGRPMFEIALQHLGTPPAQTLMIGDRLETDILGAAQVGMKSALVLSGVTSEHDIISESSIQPDAVYSDLAALLVDFQGDS